jgi:HEAT repeat protein
LLEALAREPAGSPRDRLFDLLRQLPGSAAESGLIAEALSTDAGVSRVLAIEALGQRGSERALQTLNQIARTDPQVLAQPFITTTVPDSNDTSTELPDEVVFTPRMKAMAALSASGDARAIPMLAAVLREEPDQALRMEAASALGGLRSDASTVEALILAALTDRSPFVRLAALHSLTGVLDPGLLEPLERISAGDSHPGVRLLAARVLDRLRADLRSAELGG